MGVRSFEPTDEPEDRAFVVEPSSATAAAVAFVVFALFLLNGRPLLDPLLAAPAGQQPAGAGSEAAAGPLAAALARPLFFAAEKVVELDGTSRAMVGKIVASAFSGLAAGFFFLAVARRRAEREAAWAAIVLGVGTSLWGASQSLSAQPLAAAAIAAALLFLSRAEDAPVWAGRAGAPLMLAVVAEPATIAMAAVLGLAALVRWPRRGPFLLVWAAVPAGLAFAIGVFDLGWGLAGLGRSWGPGHAALLASPATGLLLFVPAVFVGLVGLARAGAEEADRFLALAAGSAGFAHFVLVGSSTAWQDDGRWGPCLLAAALPALLLFFSEGMEAIRVAGVLLAALSIVIQALGAFRDEARWEATHGLARRNTAAVWDVDQSPILFHLQERVLVLALPSFADGRLVLCTHPVMIAGPRGSQIHFGRDALVVDGSPATMGDVHLEGAARTRGDAAVLRSEGAALFLRVLPEARVTPQVLEIEGRGQGALLISEGSFWTSFPVITRRTISGTFKLQHRYFYPESGGGDVRISAPPGQAVDVVRVRLVSAR